ncbi:MAG: CopG family antitoxin [Anaerolineales bacterium]
MPANKKPVSKTNSLKKMGEFWDKYDFTEFDDPKSPDVKFHFKIAVSVEPDLFSDIEELAHIRGINVETLVNLWLKEKLVKTKVG